MVPLHKISTCFVEIFEKSLKSGINITKLREDSIQVIKFKNSENN